MTRFDVVIIGAGMAGASLAAELAGDLSVLLLEMEDHPGHHATGRSAAFWHETYGGPFVQPLTKASLHWLSQPPISFNATGFLSKRGAISITTEEGRTKLAAFAESYRDSDVAFVPLDRADLETHCSGLQPKWSAGLYEPGCSDIDVAAYHQACLRVAKQAGAELWTKSRLLNARRNKLGWIVETASGPIHADILVNAAGAWVDGVANLCGVGPLHIQPYRRTMVQLRFESEVPRSLPLIIDLDGEFYFKSDGSGGVWLSPHDEIASEPMDAAPEEIDVATAISRLEKVVDWKVQRITHKWAGLRSFAADRLPVYGFDATNLAFFWFAGQGGFGIQTAPAAAKIAAADILGKTADPMVDHIDPARYAPGRSTLRR